MASKQYNRRAPTPIYRRIEQDMRSRVHDGHWRAGMMIPSRKALATEYGADLRTVQRAIAALLDDGTLTAQIGRGTFVACYGAGPISPRNPENTENNPIIHYAILPERSAADATIGIIVNLRVSRGEVAPRAISGAIHAAARKSSRLAFSPSLRILNLDSYADSLDAVTQQEEEAFRTVERSNLSGAIVWHSGSEQTIPALRRLVRRGIPIVLIDRYVEEIACDFVGIDNVESAAEATEYLLSLGHTRIGFLAPREPVSAIDERRAGYRKALKRAGVPYRADCEFRLALVNSVDLASLEGEMRNIVERIDRMTEPPTAMLAVNDALAHHLINALEAKGHTVPAKMSVVGFDDIDRYSPRAPFLTTIRQTFETMGERATELLLLRIADQSTTLPLVHKHILLPTELIVRRSCDPPGNLP